MSLLDRIESPADLRTLTPEELTTLAGEIRERLIDVCSRTGGHIGAGLGVVELTVALHYVFQTPRDQLVWDVGHQGYPHKLLTGRKTRLETLRQEHGLSGFLKRSESEFDAFGAGHAATSISAALGIAAGRDLVGDDYKVIAILGDGFFFGEGCLAGQSLRMASATAISECTIVQVEKSVMTRVLHDEPEFSATFIAHLLARNIRIEEDLVDQLFNSSEKRLARILLLLANFGKEGRPEEVIPNISQETLAEMIGTTRSRVSFFLNKFRKLGFIEYNGKMHIHSSLLNIVLHD